MAKIAQVSAKYIIHADIYIEGVVDRPDVIGAIFGQTEGLLGSDLELRELQKSGRIGRIEVDINTKKGKTKGTITIPSSLDKAETSIIGAAIEIIDRIGPCDAKVEVKKIEDIRISKREKLVKRAKKLLKNLMDDSMPDSQEMSDEVAHSVRMMEVEEYGKDNLPAGPGIKDNDEVIVVEGRADVLNLLKHGFKNVIALNGTSVPDTIKRLGKQKIMILFLDGDRGGKLILEELMGTTEVDFVSFAPDGKEVEELTKKEIHKGIRGKISAEQAKHEVLDGKKKSKKKKRKKRKKKKSKKKKRKTVKPASKTEQKKFSGLLDDLIGTRGACILDDDLEVLGKVPVSELKPTIKSLSGGVYAVILDGEVNKSLLKTAERAKVDYIVGMEASTNIKNSNVFVYTSDQLKS